MKKIQKNSKEEFICQECNIAYSTLSGFSHHICNSHNGLKNYFDKHLKDKDDGFCIICKTPTKFKRLSEGYKKYCSSKKCGKKYNIIRSQEGTMKKYGVTNANKLKFVRDKIKKTNIKIFGATTPLGGTSNKKITDTCLKRHGVKYPFQSKQLRDKRIETSMLRYGVEWPMQNREIADRSFKTRIKIKKYLNAELKYQGSFELDFLNRFYKKIDIIQGLSIKYIYNGKNKVYHSDFYIPSKNLIVEIKSSWILTLDLEIEEKKKAVINKGFNYIMILNKDYKEFEKIWVK